jgi:hypothetical protein
MPEIDNYSLCTIPIIQFFCDTELGTATGFIWRRHGVDYLITNWHVVAMVDPNTGANLHAKAARPDRLHLQLNQSGLRWGKIPLDLPLYDADRRPTWLVHPVHGRKVDVAIITLPSCPQGAGYYSINEAMPRDEQLAIRISMDVFVLGYPFGAGPPGLPIWKRGSIATEPQLAPIADKYFLIDSASRPGMSGAPVVLRSWGTRVTEEGATYTIAGSATRFIGVYSGRRATRDFLEAQLGMVWPAELIEVIIAGSKREREIL